MIIELEAMCQKCLTELSFEPDIYEPYGWLKCENCGYQIQIRWSFNEK